VLIIGVDPGFWFGRGTGRRPGRQWDPGAETRWESGGEDRRMLRHEVKKPLMEIKTSPYRLTLYDNIIIIIIS